MEIRLFSVTCEDCEFETLTTSNEYMSCPSCGEDSLKWSNDTILAESYDVFKEDIGGLIKESRDVLGAIVIANSYISGESTLAWYDDNEGFRLNLKETEFTDEIVKLLKLESTSDLKEKIYDGIGEDIHSLLIYDPMFECIERDRYCDEYDDLYESGSVIPSTAKKFYEWIKENRNWVVSLVGTK
ncbi:MAG: hypothetical protein IJ086_00275 [Clostridium sp.]|nr:hypothetical protein [Clostridium sp.]